MGVPGLWPLLASAAQSHNLEALDLAHLTESSASSSSSSLAPRLPVIGIDLSAWLFHARQSVEGSNPILRLIFFRLLRLLSLPLRAVFVFDGPDRPAKKRGRLIGGRKHPLTGPLSEIIRSCGMVAWEARGEAEAELARMSREGLIDAVLSDDVDALVFGSRAVMRNWSATTPNRPASLGEDHGENAVTIYKASNVEELPELSLGPNGLVLIALMAGGDYDAKGVGGCGVKMALCLAQGGYGDSLKEGFDKHCRVTGYDPESKMPIVEQGERWAPFVEEWMAAMRDELATNRQGFLASRQPRLASSPALQTFLSTAESLQILASYLHPITTWSIYETYGRSSVARPPPTRLAFSHPDIPAIAGFAQRTFAWGPKYTVGRMRNLAWKGMLLRHLRQYSRTAPLDPRDRHEEGGSAGLEVDDLDLPLIKIHSERRHAITGQRLEYRLEWDPTALAQLAESGVDPVLNVGPGFDEPLDPTEEPSPSRDEDDNDDEDLVPASPYATSLAALQAQAGREAEAEAEGEGAGDEEGGNHGPCPPSPSKRKARPPPPDPYSSLRDWVLSDRLAATSRGQELIDEYQARIRGKKKKGTQSKVKAKAPANQPCINALFPAQKSASSNSSSSSALKLPPKEKGLLKLPPKEKGLLKLPSKEVTAPPPGCSSSSSRKEEDIAAIPTKRPSQGDCDAASSSSPGRLNLLPKRTFGRTQSGPATLGSTPPPRSQPVGSRNAQTTMAQTQTQTQRQRQTMARRSSFDVDVDVALHETNDDDEEEADCSLPDALELLRSIADPNRRAALEASSPDSSPDVVLAKRKGRRGGGGGSATHACAHARSGESSAPISMGSSTTFSSRSDDGFEILLSAPAPAPTTAMARKVGGLRVRGGRKSDAIVLSDSD